MSGKMQVNRLGQDELSYELKIRGIATGTVESMRHNLAMAIRLEKSGDSVKYPDYPFQPDEDLIAVNNKLEDLEAAIGTFENSSTSGAFMKYQSKLLHVLGRLDHIPVEETEDKSVKRSVLLAKALELMGALEAKAENFEQKRRIPPQLGILETDNETSSNFNQNIGPNRRSSVTEPSSAIIKPILPSRWDCKFSGDKRGMSLSAFLEKIEELRVSRNVSKEMLFNSGIDLFTGRAYQFYLAYRNEVSTWDEFVALLREEYQSADYNEQLFEEIRRRSQGPDESIGIYLAIMSGYFKRLTCHISEEAKLKILIRNIAPFYQSQLGLVDINSINHLKELCRRLEERKQSVEKYSAPIKKSAALEPDLAYVSLSESNEALVTEVPTFSEKKILLCYRCNKPGHKAIGCMVKGERFCFKCKTKGVTIRTCPNCKQPGNGPSRS